MGPLEQQVNEAMSAPVNASPTLIDFREFDTKELDPGKLLSEVIVPLVQGLRDGIRILARHLDELDAQRGES